MADAADHDIEDRATLHRAGIQTIPATKILKPGIEAMQQRLRVDGSGKPGIYFLRDSLVQQDRSLRAAGKPTCTEEEIEGYVWADGDREQPVKADDHGLDPARYMVAHLDMKPAKREPARSQSFGLFKRAA